MKAPRGEDVVKEHAKMHVGTGGAQSVATFVEIEDHELSIEYQRPQGIAFVRHDAAQCGQHAKTDVQIGSCRRKSTRGKTCLRKSREAYQGPILGRTSEAGRPGRVRIL